MQYLSWNLSFFRDNECSPLWRFKSTPSLIITSLSLSLSIVYHPAGSVYIGKFTHDNYVKHLFFKLCYVTTVAWLSFQFQCLKNVVLVKYLHEASKILSSSYYQYCIHKISTGWLVMHYNTLLKNNSFVFCSGSIYVYLKETKRVLFSNTVCRLNMVNNSDMVDQDWKYRYYERLYYESW